MTKSDYTQTYSGKRFYLPNIDIAAITIEDIAWALSHQCRFSGHTSEFYSVAQHCVHVSYLVSQLGGTPLDQFAGLLHDAAEAYVCDIPAPFKPMIPDYCDLENKVHRAVAKKFGIGSANQRLIKRADLISLSTEARDFMGDPKDWNLSEEPHHEKLAACSSGDARGQFMQLFHALRQECRQQ